MRARRSEAGEGTKRDGSCVCRCNGGLTGAGDERGPAARSRPTGRAGFVVLCHAGGLRV